MDLNDSYELVGAVEDALVRLGEPEAVLALRNARQDMQQVLKHLREWREDFLE